DQCCFSCLQAENPPAGCVDQAATCASSGTLPVAEDRANVRCFENKRRFGVNLLYPTSRYVDALSQGEIVDARTGNMVDNPLLRGAGANAGINGGAELVFLAGIVGLPWQDVATQESLDNPGVMEYLNFKQLDAIDETLQVSRWEIILGKPGLPMSSVQCPGAVG